MICPFLSLMTGSTIIFAKVSRSVDEIKYFLPTVLYHRQTLTEYTPFGRGKRRFVRFNFAAFGVSAIFVFEKF